MEGSSRTDARRSASATTARDIPVSSSTRSFLPLSRPSAASVSVLLSSTLAVAHSDEGSAGYGQDRTATVPSNNSSEVAAANAVIRRNARTDQGETEISKWKKLKDDIRPPMLNENQQPKDLNAFLRDLEREVDATQWMFESPR